MKELRLVLEDDKHAKIKDKAKSEGRSIKSVIDELLDNYIDDKWGTLLREDMKAVDRLINRVKDLEGE